MNNLSAVGNLGRDCEIRFTKDGTAIGSFSFALSSGYGDKKKTTWLNCSLIGKRAESLAPMLIKGTQIALNGEISLNEYVNKAGESKSSVELLVSNVTLLGKPDGKSDGKASLAKEQSAPAAGGGIDDFEDDIPF